MSAREILRDVLLEGAVDEVRTVVGAGGLPATRRPEPVRRSPAALGDGSDRLPILMDNFVTLVSKSMDRLSRAKHEELWATYQQQFRLFKELLVKKEIRPLKQLIISIRNSAFFRDEAVKDDLDNLVRNLNDLIKMGIVK